MQLTPSLRAAYPAAHRLSGLVFCAAAAAMGAPCFFALSHFTLLLPLLLLLLLQALIYYSVFGHLLQRWGCGCWVGTERS